MRAMALIMMICLISCTAAANDRPLNGTGGGEVDGDFMEYQCTPLTDGRLNCLFTQIKITRAAKSEDLSVALARVEEQAKTFKGLDKETCAGVRDMLILLQGKSPPAGSKLHIDEAQRQKWLQMPAREREDQIAMMTAMLRICEKPSRDSLAAVARLEHNKKLRTCRIFTNKFEQVFSRTGPNVWAHSSAPQGECGSINVSTFERDDPRFGLWNIQMRKIVTNKSGSFLSMKCSDLDESQLTYTWRNTEFFKGCDYVRWGMF